MAAPFVKFTMSKDLIDKTLKAVSMAKDGGKIRRGVNETTKAIERGQAKLVVIAEDVAPPELVAHLPLLSDEKNIPYSFVPTKKELGDASGIPVPTSSLAIIESGSAKEMIEELAKKIEEIKKK